MARDKAALQKYITEAAFGVSIGERFCCTIHNYFKRHCNVVVYGADNSCNPVQ